MVGCPAFERRLRVPASLLQNDLWRAIERFPESPDLLTTLGLLYMQSEQHQKAFERLGTALAYQNTNTGAIVVRCAE